MIYLGHKEILESTTEPSSSEIDLAFGISRDCDQHGFAATKTELIDGVLTEKRIELNQIFHCGD